MTSKTVRCLCTLLLLSSCLLWAAAPWTPGAGFQTSLTASEWADQQSQFRACNINRAPYHKTSQSVDYDHVVWILTPFARVADYVRESHRLHQATSYEEATRLFNPSVLVVKVKTMTFNRAKSMAVRIALKTDSGTLQPFQEELTRDTLTKVGYYGKQYYIVEKNFSFDLAQVAKSKSLSALIIEADGDTREVSLEVSELR